MSAVVSCPCCNSEVRVELEIVRIATAPSGGGQLSLDQAKPRAVEAPAPEIEDDPLSDARAAIVRVCHRRGVPMSLIQGPARIKRVAAIRNEAMAEAKEAGASLAQIGGLLGGRHHTTVLASIRSHHKRQERERAAA